MRSTVLLPLVLLVLLPMIAVADPPASPDASSGTASADSMVDSMLEALGGRERWASLESLYIEALHTEERLDAPYRSEIWRDIGVPRVRIEQDRGSYRWVRLLVGTEGWQWRDGEVGALPDDELAPLLHWDRHVFYGTIVRLARRDPSLTAALDGPDRLVLRDAGVLHAVLELDDHRRPHIYRVPLLSGDGLGRTHYSSWRTSDGFVHPAVSEVPALGAVYRAVRWVPSTEPSPWRFDRSELHPDAEPGGSHGADGGPSDPLRR